MKKLLIEMENPIRERAKLLFNGVLVFQGISFGLLNVFVQRSDINAFLFWTLVIISFILALIALLLSFLGFDSNESKLVWTGFVAFILSTICTFLIYGSLFFQTLNNLN